MIAPVTDTFSESTASSWAAVTPGRSPSVASSPSIDDPSVASTDI